MREVREFLSRLWQFTTQHFCSSSTQSWGSSVISFQFVRHFAAHFVDILVWLFLVHFEVPSDALYIVPLVVQSVTWFGSSYNTGFCCSFHEYTLRDFRSAFRCKSPRAFSCISLGSVVILLMQYLTAFLKNVWSSFKVQLLYSSWTSLWFCSAQVYSHTIKLFCSDTRYMNKA